METTQHNDKCVLLRKAVEEAWGEKITGPKSFERLRTFLFNRTGQYIGMTTLKRIWMYIDSPHNPRLDTLSILARSIGYKDWHDFQQRNESEQPENEVASSPKFGRSIDVMKDLKPGNEIKLYWYPGRECHVRYLGEMLFEVIMSKNTRIKAGDSFLCHLILAGHPLYLSSLKQKNREPVSYICGKIHGGIQFERID